MTEQLMNPLQKRWKVILIGDSCIDEYRTGIVERISPEAPVPVIKQIDKKTLPGMAANVFENFKNLNIHAEFITNLEQIRKIRYIDKKSGQHLLRVDDEPEINTWNYSTLTTVDADAVVISDYNKGFLSYDAIEHVLSISKCPVFIDTKKTDLKRFGNAIVKINDIEYKARISENNCMIVTLGERGAMMLTPNKEKQYFPTTKVEVTDVCGCGDTFLASLTYEYLNTKSLELAINFANKAASITATHRGNYAPQIKEII